MRSLFTVHAGEFLAGEFIERHYSNTRVWIPSKDTGIDLLVTDKRNRSSVSFQVKFSRDFFVSNFAATFEVQLRACGWWTFDREKLRTSTADLWALVLIGFANRTNDFIIIPPKELYRRLDALHPKEKRLQTYLWVTESAQCWETRGLRREDRSLVAKSKFANATRNFSRYLNDWRSVARLDSQRRQ